MGGEDGASEQEVCRFEVDRKFDQKFLGRVNDAIKFTHPVLMRQKRRRNYFDIQHCVQ